MRAIRSTLTALSILLALAGAASAQTPTPDGPTTAPGLLQIPLSPAPPAYVPFPHLGPVTLDEENNRVGVAQAVARERGLQARILWIDAAANLERINSAAKIQALVKRIADVGFNTIVLDVRPISGQTLYPSRHCERLTEWGSAKLPATLDPVAEFVKATKAAGISLIANFALFSEGHRGFSKGAVYTHPQWQSTLCEPQLTVVDPESGQSIRVSLEVNTRAQSVEEITAYTNPAELAPTPEAAVVLVDASRRVTAVTDGDAVLMAPPAIPKGGAALVAEGPASDFLRRVAVKGEPLTLRTMTRFLPVLQTRTPGVPVWVNPHDPEVQQRLIDVVTELLAQYPVDGIVFDDRLRFAGIHADFSETTRRAFEQHVGKPLNWPDDVLRADVSFPGMVVRWFPGPYMDAWLVWRALTIRNFVARAVAAAKATRPTATVGAYVGSWYGEYPALGANWAASDLRAGFRFLTDSFRQTGFADLLDWVSPGCYYGMPTLADAARVGTPPGYTVEAAGQFANRAVNNQAWTYAGILLEKFAGDPQGLGRALQAACAATQGVMVFDLSHKIEPMWPVFRKAFSKPAKAPHAVPGLLATVRRQHAERQEAGILDPPVIIQNGREGTGL